MAILWSVLFFAVGAILGSFINVVADRLPEGKSIIWPPSHCPGCQYRIPGNDNIPIFSYLWLRGHCHNCGAVIPGRLFWVELGTAVLFVFLYWHYGLGWELAFAALFCCLFISLLLIDLERSILPNKLIYTGIVVALVVAGAGSIFGFEPVDIVGGGFELWIVDAAIGGGVGFLILLLPGLLYRGGMGWGDIKLAALIGFVTGFPLVLLAIFFAVIVGALTAAVLLLLRRKGRKDPIPFGPFLSLAAMATMFWGNDIFNLLIRALITK